jgi:LPS sulfotransferase NodH
MDVMAEHPGSSLLVATTPRSGSWLLADHLSQTGAVGTMREYFHINYVATLSDEYGLATNDISREYIAEIRQRSSSDQGVFSAKIHWLQINQLVNALRRIHPMLANSPAPELIEASLPRTRYLYLMRRDKARQAISMFRAMRSEQWWELTGPPASGPARPSQPEPVPDHLAIRWFEEDLRIEDAEWRRYFEVFGITPFTVVYEELAANPETVLRAVFQWLGRPELEVGDSEPRIRRQAGPETDRTLTEYLTLRDALPARPPGWQWSFRRRAFGVPDDNPGPGFRPGGGRPGRADEVSPL